MACIRDSRSFSNQILAHTQGDLVIEGSADRPGKTLAKLHGETILKGGSGGWPVATLKEDHICKYEEGYGNNVLMTIDGDEIRSGGNISDEVLFNIEGEASDMEKAGLAVAAFLAIGGEIS
jgi:hypothetical protein